MIEMLFIYFIRFDDANNVIKLCRVISEAVVFHDVNKCG